ncbi:MAG: hypothetical protein HRT74_00940 [Flavobacteriales bacterium]|nr:hypothetical protein [Flavobacteriales bacterium]
MSFWKKLFGGKEENKSVPSEPVLSEPKTSQGPLLSDILWAFNDDEYTSLESFTSALVEYHNDIDPGHQLNPESIFTESKSITVHYTYWVEEDEEAEEDEEEEEEVDESITLSTDHPEGFRINEFMFLLHQRIYANLQSQDAIFFEGLIPDNAGSQPPGYFLNLGS